jgi:hypothetical protein
MAFSLFIAAAVLLALASFAFARNQANRGFIDDQLRSAVSPGQRAVSVPERQLRYDADDLNAFKNLLGTQTRPGFENALRFYLRPTLIWNDIIFAIALGGFVAASWFWILAAFDVTGHLRGGLVALAAMGPLYSISDVAEDLYLERILSRQEPVTPGEASFALSLTRAKFATIVFSIQGGVVFEVLSLVFPLPHASTENPS